MQSSEAFNTVCEMISRSYIDQGWKYSKSKHYMTKKDKALTYRVFFYTSWNNVSDRNVALYGECAILLNHSKNKIFHLTTRDSDVPQGQLYWNVATPESWDQAVEQFTLWIDNVFMPIVHAGIDNLQQFVKKVISDGFYPPKGYLIDIQFVLLHGSRELAEVATKRLYESLEEELQHEFKINYDHLIQGKEAVSAYGRNMMRNYSNFKTIIENKIVVTL